MSNPRAVVCATWIASVDSVIDYILFLNFLRTGLDYIFCEPELALHGNSGFS